MTPTIPPPDDPDEARRALHGALDAGRPERRVRSLVDSAHGALDAAIDAARLAGRADVLVDVHPSDVTRANADEQDHRAVDARHYADDLIDEVARTITLPKGNPMTNEQYDDDAERTRWERRQQWQVTCDACVATWWVPSGPAPVEERDAERSAADHIAGRPHPDDVRCTITAPFSGADADAVLVACRAITRGITDGMIDEGRDADLWEAVLAVVSAAAAGITLTDAD